MATQRKPVNKEQTPKKGGGVKGRIQRYLAEGHAYADRYMAARPHRSFKVTPRMRYKRGRRVEGVWRLVKGSFGIIWREKKLLLPMALLFAVVTFVFVGGVSQLSFVDLRKSTQALFAGNLGELGSVVALFTATVTGGLNPNVGQLQQFLEIVIAFLFWLAYVWILRRRLADQPTTIREALYNSGGPIIPSAMVVVVVFLQMIPAAIGVFGIGLVFSGIWLQGGVESMLICAAGGLLCLLSFYWVAGSSLAMVVVTLPGMYPWRALSAASELVVAQRWRLALRLAVLSVVLFVVWAVVLIPLIVLEGWLRFDWLPLIPIFVQLLGAFSLTYAATYIYKMYRSML